MNAVPGVRQQPVVCAKLRRVSSTMYYDIEVTIAQQTASTTKWAALKVWIWLCSSRRWTKAFERFCESASNGWGFVIDWSRCSRHHKETWRETRLFGGFLVGDMHIRPGVGSQTCQFLLADTTNKRRFCIQNVNSISTFKRKIQNHYTVVS